jgi:LPS-assembly lipoprotein
MSLSRLLAGLLLLTLQACGFHLQGTLSTPAVMQQTFIETNDRHSPFYLRLRRELKAAGIELVDDESSAGAVFTLYEDHTNQRVLSVSARNVPTEYEVYYTIRYGLTNGTNTMLEVQDLTLTRDYTYDATLVLGKAREEQMLRDEIAKDLVRIVLEQFSALN